MTNVETVRASFDAYRRQHRATAERLLADAFVFTSPQDDHIDKAAFLARCFPTADRFRTQDIVHLVDVDPTTVLLIYEYELESGERYRNAELVTMRDGRLAETQVFFGGRAPT